ncbi:MAG: KaiC domain-containing protein [Halobacteriales archaeon]|nr:KaiC domain-containing protein [Halobacteriales archaeon]
MSEEEAEDDWFESAFSEDDTTETESDDAADAHDADEDEDEEAVTPDPDPESESESDDDPDPDAPAEGPNASEDGAATGTVTEPAASADADMAEAGPTDSDEGEGEFGGFDMDDGTGSPADAGVSDGADEMRFDPDAGVGGGDAGPDGTDVEDGNLFEDDFASAFQNAPSPDAGPGGGPGGAGAGMGEFGGGQDFGMDEGFEADEDFESDIPRIEIGIEGLDSMIQGGVPQRSLMVTIGAPGTGKTTFGLQFLQQALEAGDNAVYITLEESYDRVLNTADDKGWEFSEYVDNNQLAIVDLDPVEMANSLTSIRSELPSLVRDFGATRLVLDSVSLLEMMYDQQATRRNEIFDFTTSLKEAGVTTMLTSEASEDNPFVSRFGIIEYLTDAVFVLRYIRPDDFRETRLAVEIQKIRDANHSRETKPYEITNEGISVYRQANIF